MYFRLLAAIFDFPVALTSDNIHNSPTVLQDLDLATLWGQPLESRCYLIQKLRYTTLRMYFRLMAAIFELPVTTT